MRILNLYAGLGGNRKKWEGHEITAVEINPDIAKVYKDNYPQDIVIVADAHEYLIEHYNDFDFIWSSPPCQSHSRTNYFLNKRGVIRYPDMKLYQEIIFLRAFFKGAFCVENVKGYYEPLIKPVEINRHYFWTNFYLPLIKFKNISIGKMCGENQTKRRKTIEMVTTERYGIDLLNINIKNKQQLVRNMVDPEIGFFILNSFEKTEARGQK
jgi:DNA (cytosine-5)-methyltransferase 1